jgi:hypothetical protein
MSNTELIDYARAQAQQAADTVEDVRPTEITSEGIGASARIALAEATNALLILEMRHQQQQRFLEQRS